MCAGVLARGSVFGRRFAMNFSESGRSSAPSRRRHDAKRRRVETAVDRLIRRLRLLPEKGRKLSEGIYGFYRSLVGQKSFDDQPRQHRKLQNRAEQELAVR